MSQFEGYRALILEDDQVSFHVIHQMLNQLGVEVEFVQNMHGIAAVLQDIQTPHVIFLDLEMPALNGYEVLNVIQSMAHLDGIPVVAYTTHVSHMNEAQQAGFHSFLGKPLDSAEFPHQLAGILAGEPVWEAS